MEDAACGDRDKLMTLVKFLSAGYEQFDPVDDILDALDCARIPLAPMNMEDTTQVVTVQDAAQAITNGISVFRSINLTPLPRKTQEYSSLCYRRLIDQWRDVSKWMAHSMTYTSNMGDPRTFLLHCAELVRTIFDRANPYAEDILTQHCTADLVYLLLSQKVRMGVIDCFVMEPDMAFNCPMFELFRSYFLSNTGFAAGQERLQIVSRGTRNRVIRSILGRCEELSTLASDQHLDQIAHRFRCLAAGVMRLVSTRDLGNAFTAHDFLYVQSCSISRLCDKARASRATRRCFWDTISETIFVVVRTAVHMVATNPGTHIRRLMEGNLLGCAFLCLPHIDFSPNSGVYAALSALMPYMPLPKVYESLKSRQRDLLGWPSSDMRPEAQTALRDCQYIIGIDAYAYSNRADIPVDMCANRKHNLTKTKTPISDDFNALKSCVCRNVVYCSDACQREDWNDFHSRECSTLASQYRDRKWHNAWPSFRTKRDHVKFLEGFANFQLPPPEALKTLEPKDKPFSEAVFMPYPFPVNEFKCHGDSIITTLDFLVRGRLSAILRFPLKLHLYDAWGHPTYSCWQPRIQQYVDDMEDDINIILLECVTRYDSTQSISTLAVLRYNPDAPEGGRYTTVNAVSRLCDCDLQDDNLPIA